MNEFKLPDDQEVAKAVINRDVARDQLGVLGRVIGSNPR